MDAKNALDSLNIKKQCQKYGVGLWQCPRFLFVIMGIIIIGSILATNSVAQNYFTEPQIVALIVLVVAGLLFAVGSAVVSSFERVAMASRDKSEFVNIMSHQLRTPLSNIKWEMNLLAERKVNIEDPEARKFFSNLNEENQRMIYMINDLLELNRIEDKTLYLNPAKFSLKEVVEGIVERRNKSLSDSGISVEILDSKNNFFVFADKDKIRSVFSHILDNAMCYSAKNGKITVMLEEAPKFIRCSISDEGIGISMEDAKRIFSKFFRAESALRYETQGMGLRLYIAKSIVEASGGKIGFKPNNSKGSIFWFTLPSARV